MPSGLLLWGWRTMKRTGLVEMQMAEGRSTKHQGQTLTPLQMFVCDAKTARQLVQSGAAHYLRPHRPPPTPRRRVSGRDAMNHGLDRAILGKEHGEIR
jgi:hypothetical protein